MPASPRALRSPLRVPRIPALLAVALFVLFASSPAAVAEPGPDSAEAYEDPPTAAEHYTELLSEQPEGAAVVVDDAVGGVTPHEELAEELHAAFEPLGVPYHVVVSPFVGAGTPGGMDEIMPAVRDRLGADGVYVLLPPKGLHTELQVYGVELSVDGARDAVRDAELYTAPVGEVAPVLAAGLAGEEPPVVDRDRRPEGFLGEIDPNGFNGPANLGLLVGTTGTALVIIGGWVAWRWARRGRRVLPVVALVVAPVAAGSTVAGGYAYTMSAPVGGSEVADPEDLVRLEAPYVADPGRAERLAAALTEDPLYVDPLSSLSREGLVEAREALDETSVPVYVAVVPLATDDEAGGDAEVLAAALASVARRDGVYLVVGPGIDDPDVGAAPSGLEIDSFALWSPMSRNEEPTPAATVERAVADLAELEFAPGDGFTPLFADDEPNLPEPRGERFWGGEGFLPGSLFLGPMLAALAIGPTYLVFFLWGHYRNGGLVTVMGSARLRRLADKEAGRVRRLLDRGPEGVPARYMPQAEAVLMLVDRDLEALDLLGVVVLARRVVAAAEEPEAATEPCAVNPLHPFSGKRHHTRVTGGKSYLCENCGRLKENERDAKLLKLRTASSAHSYRKASKNPWIRYSFGAKEPDRMITELLGVNRVH
ncbi:MAG TPA: hypothetical protein K8V84_17340 [Nocardiopsis listeri]|uniref:hypothetical protein n=1 Tax=Nocardiopsis listeri TaxID=53440 RepID=UPI001D552F7E|nr:hypothetical protein [Nocardiopsis listeri]HJE60249.1 hypothetical protein [Nocardiopsis listeri]